MARPILIQSPSAVYEVMARGHGRTGRRILILMACLLATLAGTSAAPPSGGAENNLAEAVRQLGNRLDQLAATAEPPLFKRHLISVNAIVHSEAARAMLYAGSDPKAAEEDYVVGYDWETSDAALLMDYQCGIWDLNTNGTLSGVISADCFDDAPARSPADGRIAFHNLSPSGSVAGLYVAVSDGSGRQRIVSNVAGASWPAWSPDGQTLVFADSNNTNVDSGKNLWVVDPDGSNLIQISGFSDLTSGFPHGALWSPDSAALVSVGTVFGTNGLWVIPLTPERDGCDGPPYRLPTSPGDPIDFSGSIVVAPSTLPNFAVLPGLFIRLAPTAVVVYWTTGYAGFTLEYKSAVSPDTPWTPINGPYYLAGNYYECWEATGSLQAAKFFRLRYTGAVVLSQPPALTGQVQSGSASLSWPTNVAGFVLQSTTNLSPPVFWQDVAPPYDLSGLSFVYQDAAVGSAPRKFFRLRAP